MRFLVVLLILLTPGFMVFAQDEVPDIRKLVAQVNDGADDGVREQLPALVSKFPNDAGVLYLQALLTREGADAVRTYQSIVDNFPQSEWADDALYKVYQFYYALGLYRTAELKFNQLKTSYPSSPYAAAAVTDVPAGDLPAPLITDQTPAVTTEQPAVLTKPETNQNEQTEEAPGDAAPGTAEPAPVSSETAIPVHFSLQIGAFTLQANAETQKTRFESLGYSADMVSKVRDTRALFIVLVGDYPTYEEAKKAAAGVKKKTGVDAMVISR